MAKSTIKEAVIAVTYRCNSRCQMCNIWKRKDSDFLHPKDFLNLPKDLRDINITGGEPFLRADLLDIVKVLSQHCPKANIIISSNGFATSLIAEQMKKILTVKPDIGVAISLDGIGEKHQEIRGVENAFDKVIATIIELRNLGVKNLKIGFTLGDYNTHELPRVYKLAHKYGLEFSLAIVHSSENYFGKENKIKRKKAMLRQLDWLIKKELNSWDLKRWARAYFTFGAREYLQRGMRILPDYSGRLNIFIDPKGNVFPCDVSTTVMGNIHDADSYVNKNRKIKCIEEPNWMMCTARQAIKKHYIKVICWILVHRFLFKNNF